MTPHWQRLAVTLTHHLTLTTSLTLLQARQRLTYHLRLVTAGWHEWEAWHVVEAYEAVIADLPKDSPCDTPPPA